MIRRSAPLLLNVLFILAAAAAAADWRSDVAGFFTAEKGADYRAARAYLDAKFDSLAEDDKPAACGLLAFLEARLGDRPAEYRRLGDYFERYGAIDMGFQFLPPAARSEFYRYIRDWQLRYPWVMKLGVVSSSAVTVHSSVYPPDSLILGVEMAGEVLYKLSANGEVIKGGMFRRGFNEIVIEARHVFRESGNYPYTLEFKAGDLVIRRALTLNLRRETYGQIGRRQEARTAEYSVKLYLGERLLAANQRTAAVAPPLDIPVPPQAGQYDPFGPGYQNEPKYPGGVPLAALPGAVKEIFDAFKKRNATDPVPPVELKVDMQYVFSEQSPDAPSSEVRAHLWLDIKSIQFLSYTAQK
jgi:hypothetical protein